MADSAGSVVVLGSVNVDHVVVADVFPAPGQTVLGRSARFDTGGKGANQAVAAAVAGASVRLVARVGQDAEGERARADLAGRHVDVAAVTAIPGETTGSAWITVAEQDDTIVVVPGANGRWPDQGDPAVHAVPTGGDAGAAGDPCGRRVRAAVAHRGRFVPNAAPAAGPPDQLLSRCGVLVVNQHELAVVARTAGAAADGPDLDRAHAALLARGVGAVVTTLGAAGAVVTDGTGTSRLPAVPAIVVDTTGAGDAFTGVLAARLAAGDGIVQAAHWAGAAGSHAVRSVGAQPSYVSRDVLEQTLEQA